MKHHAATVHSQPSIGKIYAGIWRVIQPERRFYAAIMVYSVAIGLLTLAIPISVQALISSVTNLLLTRPVVVLSLVLLVLLGISAAMQAAQLYLTELIERRFFARLSEELVMQLLQVDARAFRQMNRTAMTTRFFEIMHVQKLVPNLLLRGFSLLLQMTVGLVLVSFYHPYLLAMNLFIFGTIFLVWRIWRYASLRWIVEVSNEKYDMARLLGELGRANVLYRSQQAGLFAVKRCDDAIGRYLRCRKKFFRAYFAQHISFLSIYVIGSAALLGIGGWLVVRQQLTIGQLVAAELIMSAIFYGLARLGYHLLDFYELSAACKKIGDCLDLPSKTSNAGVVLPDAAAFSLTLSGVNWQQHHSSACQWDIDLPAGSKIMAKAESQALELALMQFLRQERDDYRGMIRLNGVDIADVNPSLLLNQVHIIDHHYMIECSIEEWLRIAAPQATPSQMMNTLALVEMEQTIDHLPDGLQTRLLPSGYPLQFSELMRLKLAAALLAAPPVIIINGLFDILIPAKRARILARIRELPMTFIYFTNGYPVDGMDGYLYLSGENAQLFEGRQAFEEAVYAPRG